MVEDNILLKASTFYIKIVGADLVVGQFGVVEKYEKPHDSLLSAIRDIHSRMIIGFHNSQPIMPLKQALEESDKIITNQIGYAVGDFLGKNNLFMSNKLFVLHMLILATVTFNI